MGRKLVIQSEGGSVRLIHSSQLRAIAARSRWSGAERRSDATELPVRRVFSSRQIAAAIAVEIQKPAVQGCRGPVFVDLTWG